MSADGRDNEERPTPRLNPTGAAEATAKRHSGCKRPYRVFKTVVQRPLADAGLTHAQSDDK